MVDKVVDLPVIDPASVNPLEYRVLLKVGKAEKKTNGGIILPDQSREKEEYHQIIAEVVSCGEEAFTSDKGGYIENKPKCGDRVIVAKYAGLMVRDKDANLYRFANDKDVIAVIEEEKND